MSILVEMLGVGAYKGEQIAAHQWIPTDAGISQRTLKGAIIVTSLHFLQTQNFRFSEIAWLLRYRGRRRRFVAAFVGR
jgi:hypothetical protein